MSKPVNLRISRTLSKLSNGSSTNPSQAKKTQQIVSQFTKFSAKLEKLSSRFQNLADVTGPLLHAEQVGLSPSGSDWLFFFKYNYARLSKKSPSLESNDIRRSIASDWGKMTNEEKKDWPISMGFKIDESVESTNEFYSGKDGFLEVFRDWDALAAQIIKLKKSVGLTRHSHSEILRMNEKNYKESNIYTLFFQDRYRQISYMNPQLTPQEITKLISLKWKKAKNYKSVKL
ncbi:hypothetical protein WICPIJ_005005 [Wickerhamomyces pijperi]|uniref:HMG box domain-containing protein n=1 Tax=Wickerhamomyces pijperi TaxID=599730 RepID=A0A9P8TLJ0_WICPI|nr:hypothetical protein WICPIJ_005005 [Wickerhamomyces pijperi]